MMVFSLLSLRNINLNLFFPEFCVFLELTFIALYRRNATPVGQLGIKHKVKYRQKDSPCGVDLNSLIKTTSFVPERQVRAAGGGKTRTITEQTKKTQNSIAKIRIFKKGRLTCRHLGEKTLHFYCSSRQVDRTGGFVLESMGCLWDVSDLLKIFSVLS